MAEPTGTIRYNPDGSKVYLLAGKEVSAEQFHHRIPTRWKRGAPAYTAPSEGYPKVSLSMAVDPSQTQEAMDHAKKLGVPTTFTPGGEPIFESRAHQREFVRKHGFVNRDGGYGD